MKKSLNDLDQGLKGNLNITDAMEDLTKSLTLDQIPGTWAKAAYASNKMLGEWLADPRDSFLSKALGVSSCADNMYVEGPIACKFKWAQHYRG